MRNVTLAKHLITAVLFHIMHSNIQKEYIEMLKISQTILCVAHCYLCQWQSHDRSTQILQTYTEIYQSQNWMCVYFVFCCKLMEKSFLKLKGLIIVYCSMVLLYLSFHQAFGQRLPGWQTHYLGQLHHKQGNTNILQTTETISSTCTSCVFS